MSLLPFVLSGKASLSPQPTADAPTVKRKLQNTTMGASYTVRVEEMTDVELQCHKRELTMVPIDNGYNGSTNASFDAYQTDDVLLHVPRFYGYAQWGAPTTWDVSDGEAMTMPFAGTLNAVQQTATSSTLAQLKKAPHGALLVLPCGYGKTVCALWLAQALGRRTLVLVHKGFLVQQWHERARMFLPNARLGIIQQNKIETDADIVVGMVQSISKREYGELLRVFGTVIIDEAHHMSAPVFNKALHCLPARYVCGLSATPERKDGLTNLLYHSMGTIAHRIERAPEHTLVSCMLYEGGKRKEIKYRDGRVSMPLMLNALVTDDARNLMIAQHIARFLNAGRHVIVLTDRIVQLKVLHKMLLEHGVQNEAMGYYIGTTSVSERESSSHKPCILSTYSMAKEGLDIPRLDTLVMATPKADIVQASGRVQRKHPEKATPLIVDIVDTFSVFEALRWKRWNFYRNEKFNCQTFDVSNDDVEWFV